MSLSRRITDSQRHQIPRNMAPQNTPSLFPRRVRCTEAYTCDSVPSTGKSPHRRHIDNLNLAGLGWLGRFRRCCRALS